MTDITSSGLTAAQPLNDLPQTDNLTPEQQTQIQAIVKEIDIYDPAYSLGFGAQTMKKMSQFSDSLMQQVRAKDAGVIGSQLTDLLQKKLSRSISAPLSKSRAFLPRCRLWDHFLTALSAPCWSTKRSPLRWRILLRS